MRSPTPLWAPSAGHESQTHKRPGREDTEIHLVRGPRPIAARGFHHRDSQSQGGAGTWQGSNRGAGSSANVPRRGGYQSGGASDSEGGRGRGGGFRGRGRGGGDDRGGRGGRGVGRGSFQNKNTDGPSDSKPTESKSSESKPAATAGES